MRTPLTHFFWTPVGEQPAWKLTLIYIDLVATLMIFGLVTFAKIKLHPPSSIIRSATHLALHTVEFCVRAGQISKRHVVVRSRPTCVLGIL